jgi:UDP-glucuronate 4-epimerase
MEKAFGKTTTKEMLPLQPGDVEHTYADIGPLQNEIGYSPRVSIEQGLELFAKWYMDYYQD